MTRFYVLRHAHKKFGGFFNPDLRHQDEPLTERGMEMAQKLPGCFVDKDITAVYISAYLRTRQTIEPTCARLGLEPVMDERLNEVDNGLWDGLSEVNIQSKYPRQWRAFTERRRDFRFPEGETGREASKRVAAFLEEKRLQHEGKNVLAVAHEGIMRTLACHVLGLPIYRRWIFCLDFCGLMELHHQPERGWTIVRLNQALV